MILGVNSPRPRPHFVIGGPSHLPPPPPKKGTSPQFFDTFVMAKRLDGSRCHLVLRSASSHTPLQMGTHTAHQERGTAAPTSAHVFCMWPNCSTDQDGTWYGGRPRLRPHCIRWGLSPPPQKCLGTPVLVYSLYQHHCARA